MVDLVCLRAEKRLKYEEVARRESIWKNSISMRQGLYTLYIMIHTYVSIQIAYSYRTFSAISNVNPSASFVHIRRPEYHQIAEASKRRGN